MITLSRFLKRRKPSEIGWEQWPQQSWVAKTAKKEETFKSTSSWDWKAARDRYDANPEEYIANIKRRLKSDSNGIEDGLSIGSLTEAGRSGDVKLMAMQEVINRMADANDIQDPPKLLIF